MVTDGGKHPIPYEHEVEKYCAYALGLIAIKPEYQQLVVDAGALPAPDAVIRRACDTIAVIARENVNTKNLVRIEGGIHPLVELLSFFDIKVQTAAAGALRTLAFKNDENKNQIVVECGALPTLVLMLRSEDPVMSSDPDFLLICWNALLAFSIQQPNFSDQSTVAPNPKCLCGKGSGGTETWRGADSGEIVSRSTGGVSSLGWNRLADGCSVSVPISS